MKTCCIASNTRQNIPVPWPIDSIYCANSTSAGHKWHSLGRRKAAPGFPGAADTHLPLLYQHHLAGLVEFIGLQAIEVDTR